MTALPSPGSVSLRSALAGRSVGIRCSIGAEDSAVVRESTAGRGRLSTTGVTTGGCRTIAGAGSGLTTAGTGRSKVDAFLTARTSGRVDVDVGSRAADADGGASDSGIAARSTGTAVTGGGVTRLWKCETTRSNPVTQTTAAMMPAVAMAAVMRSVNGRRRGRTRRRGFPRAFTERGRDAGS